ncbi:hypothetical protein M9H77_07537 [Catharanthus roseus]|uniref:Uncharacterized protein n=1 Tax=Catharanthus roseus TaxID=4058 RepID=A0ACC0BVG5_CATRO|nr:hypothetical protein M9H77_07537 [Catharanthus roseus]
MNRKSPSSMEVKLGLMTRAQRKKLKLQEDNDMLVYMISRKAFQVVYNVYNHQGAIKEPAWGELRLMMGELYPTTDDRVLHWKLELEILNRGLIMSTNGHMPSQSHQEGPSNSSRMNLNETLRSMQQSIEKLARDVEDLKKGKSSATMKQRVGDNLSGGRRGGLGGRGYHRSQEDYPRQEAWHDDNFYEDYGDNPNISHAYHRGYYGNQQGDKALDKIKGKVPGFKRESDPMSS